MWPKALAQLIELLPHAARLLPMADRFMQSRAGNDEATRAAMDSLRGELAKSVAAHEGLYRQMNEQGESMRAALAEVRATRAALEASEAKIAGVEAKVGSLRGLLVAVLLVNVLLAVLVIVLLVRH